MIIIASDKFKGTFSADEICRMIGGKVARLFPDASISLLPMADGGEGTSRLLAGLHNLPEITCQGIDPFGNTTAWRLYSDGETAAVESAAILGREATGNIVRPLLASSFPLGLVLRKLANQGIRKIYVGVGGTMTTDGGGGFLQALGWSFYDIEGNPIDNMINPRLLPEIGTAVPPDVNVLSGISVIGLMDVDVPLLPSDVSNESMSALSFAPQKGVGSGEIGFLRQALSNYQEVILKGIGKPESPWHYCGAGGGLGFALQVAGSTAEPGAAALWKSSLKSQNIIAEMISHIYTGEGCFDLQSLQGKVTGTIIEYGTRLSIPVTVVCGRCDLPADLLPEGVDVVLLSDFL